LGVQSATSGVARLAPSCLALADGRNDLSQNDGQLDLVGLHDDPLDLREIE
jgi:hypothetical protein